MARQICFYEKNFLDFDNEAATITATEGDEFAKFIRSRSLRNAWMTTGSEDEDETTVEFDLGSIFNIDTFIIVDHNLKSYKIEQFATDTGIWQEIYSTENDTKDTSEISLDEFFGQRFRIVILGTQVPDSDKRINRIIITKKLGQFSHWPKIESPVIDQGKVLRKTLSGKNAILRTVGAFRCSLTIGHWRKSEDLELIERLYRQVQGFEVWISAGNEDQFFYAAEGYRNRDIYLMGFSNDWSPRLKDGIYVNGFDLRLDLVEVVS